MEDNSKLLESLLERIINYGQSSLELAKLKAIDKSIEVSAAIVPQIIVTLFLGSFILFLSLGVALWLGEILGKLYFGMAVVAGFYAFCTLFTQLFLRKWISRISSNLIIRNIFKS